jgi:CHAT domain-containing protein/tetratricopeptide (TPR) repeat protein
VIRGRRDGEDLTVTIPHLDLWRLDTRPTLADVDLTTYRRAAEPLAGAEPQTGARLYEELASANGEERTRRVWLLMKLGQGWAARKAWPEAHEALRRAIEAAPGPREQVAILLAEAKVFEREQALDKAAEVDRRALELTRGVEGEGLTAAVFMMELGNLAYFASHFEEAEHLYRQTLAIRERLAPGSWVLAATLNNIANARAELGDHVVAEELYRRALEVSERLAPDGPRTTAHLNNLAIEVRIRGDLAQAQALLEKARTLEQQRAPSEGSLFLADVLHSLARVAHAQRDLERAQQLFQESLAIQERLAPEAPATTMRLDSLGEVAKELGDLAAAESYLKRSLERAQKLSPESQEVVQSLTNLGLLEHKRGHPDRAEEMLRQALHIQDARAPHDIHAAAPLEGLGDLFAEAGRYDEADAAYRRCLEIHQRLSPGSGQQASALARLGRVARRRGDRNEALRLHLEALSVLDEQSSRLGGGEEARLAFGREFDAVYRDTIALLVDQGHADQALHVLERSRARSFLALLAERDLVDADIPSELDAKRRRLDTEYDRTQGRLGDLDPRKDAEAIATVSRELRDLRAAQVDMAGQIRRASPRFAALRSPEALDLAGVQAALDPGTVLLSFAVADDRTDLFVVSREGGLHRYLLPHGRRPLEEKVRAFRERIARAHVAEVPALRSQGADLYDLLLKPAEDEIAKATRLVICPDGPLHTLPFAALRRNERYLVETKPLHVAISATVYAELRHQRDTSPRGTVVAFGDPRYPLPAAAKTEAVRDASLRDGLRRGLTLAALPATRTEVESIARLYGKDARLFVGDAATEENAKSQTRAARYVHFACHGFLDERVPLNSGLALATRAEPKEGEDNGLLQAWEVFERVRVDADLVTLSACDSGLGKEMGGEGLIGLTRAFQYAGARSVVASLWAVSDRSTVDLMRTFYEGLSRGLAKDEALRRAQMAAIATGDVRSRPLRWAGFQLFGDWQ